MDLEGIDVASANIVWKMCIDNADSSKNSDSASSSSNMDQASSAQCSKQHLRMFDPKLINALIH